MTRNDEKDINKKILDKINKETENKFSINFMEKTSFVSNLMAVFFVVMLFIIQPFKDYTTKIIASIAILFIKNNNLDNIESTLEKVFMFTYYFLFIFIFILIRMLFLIIAKTIQRKHNGK